MPYYPPSTSSGAPVDATYIVQIPDSTLTNEQAIADLASGILLGEIVTGIISSLPFPGGTTTFLRADGQFEAVTAVASISQTEIDFGPKPVSEALFTIVDINVSSASRILAQVAYVAPTDKDRDEIEMDDIQLRCGPFDGYFELYARAADGSYLADKFVINYQVGA